MGRHQKRWLISVMKTSGSKRKRVINGNYSDTRNAKKTADLDLLPSHEPIKSTKQFYNGKINYGLLVRFLRGKVGSSWDQVYSEILDRIPSKLLDYREMIFWFVADMVEKVDGRLWDKSSQQYIWEGEAIPTLHYTEIKKAPRMVEFYVDPETGALRQIQQRAHKRVYSK